MKYKVGDKVKVRTWEDMKKEYGLNGCGSIACNRSFTDGMKEYCGKYVTITSVGFWYDIKEDFGSWQWSDDMFEDENKLDKIILQKKDVVFIDYGDGFIRTMEVDGWAGSKAIEIAGTVIKILRKGKAIYKTNLCKKPLNKFFFKKDKTIYYDKDGKRYVVKCCEDDIYDKKVGMLYVLAKAQGIDLREIDKLIEEQKKVKEIKIW